MQFNSLALCLGLAGLAQAHMEMIYPPPFKSKANTHAGSDVDYSMTAPLEASGGNFPCKGYHSLFGTEQGASVANWEAGGSYNMSIAGGANHGGGSCQASLSFDKGETWSVIHSYVGNCPGSGTSTFDFKVPTDAPSGEAIFAWTWFNLVGNREMYMNCAAVTIAGSGKSSTMSKRPAMFVANVGNGCTTKEASDLEFPDPGPDVSNDSQKTAKPDGSCGNAGSGGGSESGDGSAGGDDGAAPSAPAGGNDGPGAAPSAPSAPADGPAGGNDGSYPGAPDAPAPAPTQTQPAAQPSGPAGGVPSAPGGVFITVSQPAEATGAPAPSAPSGGGGANTSTLLTLTKPAPTSIGSPEPAPTAPPAPDTDTGNGGSGSGSQQTPGAACDQEGQWNCISGSQYQRCASGRWSVVQSMAAGTTCSGSENMTFAMGFGRKLALRARRARRV
ncbi:hypothetical protein F66182_7979 [Fusarium sp. NRRL 66182]|nr:hypothetical protein F66182_7979 [Fusarium sp. NRRL 66182]